LAEKTWWKGQIVNASPICMYPVMLLFDSIQWINDIKLRECEYFDDSVQFDLR